MPPRAPSVSPEQKQILENTRKNEVSAKTAFPKEKFINASLFKLEQEGPDFEVPKNLDNIKIAKSKITPTKGKSHISDNDAKTLAKELRQARILTSKGASVYLVPKIKDAQGRDVPGPDALVNGILYEFKTITGTIGKVEKHFRNSRNQSSNVFLRLMRHDISKDHVISKIKQTLNDPKYTGGTKGRLLLHLESTGKTYFLRIKDLK